MAAARRVLAADISEVPLTRVTQFALGWMRAAFDQSQVIATLTQSGLARAASPNRRTFAEIAVRLQWLRATNQEDRAGAVDAMLEHEQELTEKAIDHIRKMGYDSQREMTEMREFVLDAAAGKLKNEARLFLAAAQSTEGQSLGLFYAWREETQYTHATGAMAASYAPASAVSPFPNAADETLETHSVVLFLIVTLVFNLLVDEGVDRDAAMAIVDAFLGTT